MKKSSVWKKLGLGVVAAALVASFVGCANPANNDAAGGDTPAPAAWDGKMTVKVEAFEFAKGDKAGDDGKWCTQAQPSIMDADHYPKVGDTLAITIKGTLDAKLPNLTANLAGSTDGKTANGKDCGWWTVYNSTPAVISATEVAAGEVNYTFEITLDNDAPGDKTTNQWGKEENELLLVLFGSADAEADVSAAKITVSEISVVNKTQAAK